MNIYSFVLQKRPLQTRGAHRLLTVCTQVFLIVVCDSNVAKRNKRERVESDRKTKERCIGKHSECKESRVVMERHHRTVFSSSFAYSKEIFSYQGAM